MQNAVPYNASWAECCFGANPQFGGFSPYLVVVRYLISDHTTVYGIKLDQLQSILYHKQFKHLNG